MLERTQPIAQVSATVSVLAGGGPRPVDAEGNVHAGTHIDVEAVDTIIGLSIAEFELSDSVGVITRGTPSAQLTEVAPSGAAIGPFTGDIPAGAHVRLWVSMRLEASEAALRQRPPEQFRIVLTSHDGIATAVTGKVFDAAILA